MFTIFNQRLAGYLMLNGFKLMSIEPNRKIAHFNTFLFEDSDKLRNAIQQYSLVRNSLSPAKKREEVPA